MIKIRALSKQKLVCLISREIVLFLFSSLDVSLTFVMLFNPILHGNGRKMFRLKQIDDKKVPRGATSNRKTPKLPKNVLIS